MNDFVTLRDGSVVYIRNFDDAYLLITKKFGENFTLKLKSLIEDNNEMIKLENDVGLYIEDLDVQEHKLARFKDNVEKIDRLAKQANSLIGKTGLTDKQLHNFFTSIIDTMEDIIHG